MIAMNWPDIDNAAELYRRGALPLKAVAWAIARFRDQDGQPLTAADLMRHAGASKTAAYRAVAELRLAAAATPAPIGDSRTSGPDRPEAPPVPVSGKAGLPDSRKAGKSVPESGNPPTPPYKATEEKERDTREGVPSCGNPRWEDGGLGRAAAILAENLQSEPLAGYLARNAHLPEVAALAADTGDGRYPAGWRLESAATQFLSPRIPDSVRSCRNLRASLGYFLSMARGLDRPYVPPSLAAAAAGAGPAPGGPARRGPDVANMDFSRYE